MKTYLVIWLGSEDRREKEEEEERESNRSEFEGHGGERRGSDLEGLKRDWWGERDTRRDSLLEELRLSRCFTISRRTKGTQKIK